jgi:DNA-binding MarR family transcriptional regulator
VKQSLPKAGGGKSTRAGLAITFSKTGRDRRAVTPGDGGARRAFSLSEEEWRILAVPGARLQLATKEISRLTTLDKMNVSRALQALEARGILRRAHDPDDGRERIVMLTIQGRALYRRIIALALEREAALLGVLTAAEIEMLDKLIRKLSAAASARTWRWRADTGQNAASGNCAAVS